MARSGRGTSDETVVETDITGTPAVEVVVSCITGSSQPLRCRIPAIHGDTDYALLAAGQTQTFRSPNGRIGSIFLAADASGNASYQWFISAGDSL